jgi:hypothetical protein
MSPAERAWLRACWVALNGGPALTGELAWCRPDWVAGLALAREARRLVGITVMWWHDAPLQALPARVGGPGGPLALSLQRVDQASVPRLQCAQITPLGGTARSVTGTVGALATDWYDANALYALTAGHVLGAQAQAAFDDPVRIEVPRGVAIDRARLAEWSTVLSGGRRSFGIDAGMARLSAAEAAQLLAQAPDLLPASVVVSTPEPGAALQLHRRDGSTLAAVQGREYLAQTVVTQLCQPSGAVDEVTLRIERLQSYRLDSPSEHGDSGGAVWDDQQRLVGLHCGFVDGAQAGAANAVYTRIDDVMQRFEVEPITRQSQQSPLLRRLRWSMRRRRPRWCRSLRRRWRRCRCPTCSRWTRWPARCGPSRVAKAPRAWRRWPAWC